MFRKIFFRAPNPLRKGRKRRFRRRPKDVKEHHTTVFQAPVIGKIVKHRHFSMNSPVFTFMKCFQRRNFASETRNLRFTIPHVSFPGMIGTIAIISGKGCLGERLGSPDDCSTRSCRGDEKFQQHDCSYCTYKQADCRNLNRSIALHLSIHDRCNVDMLGARPTQNVQITLCRGIVDRVHRLAYRSQCLLR